MGAGRDDDAVDDESKEGEGGADENLELETNSCAENAASVRNGSNTELVGDWAIDTLSRSRS